MKTIFKSLNIQLTKKQSESQSTNLLIIKNRDGSPRWICNSNAKEPLFLKFYSLSTFRAMLFAFAIKLIFKLRLQKKIFKTKTVYYKNNSRRSIINISNTNWALFTGTVGPNNKLLVFEKNQTETSFYKIANTTKSISLIENERNTLEKLSKQSPKKFTIPTSKMLQEKVLKLQDISAHGKRNTTFIKAHQNALSEIYAGTSQEIDIYKVPVYNETIQKLEHLEQTTDQRIPKGLVKKLRLLADTIQNNKIIVGLSHGDFTPWNMYLKNNSLAIYDWELSRQKIPVGFDAFHFIIQQGILVDRNPWKKIKQGINNSITPELFSLWSKNNHDTIEEYLKMYLLINTVSHLQLYAEQSSWHTQVYWLLHTWNDAISECVGHTESHRGLLILDTFDFLYHKNYAAIKFPNSAPNKLSEYSDIDLSIEKKDLNIILDYLKHHSLTIHTQVVKKSFMASVQVFLNDDSLLSLDLIWKFKRKSIVMLNAKKIIKKSCKNSFGVKQMRLIDKVRYIGLFYGLNNAKIPSKYKAYEQLLATKNNTLDNILYCNYLDDDTKKERLVNHLKNKQENKHFNRIANSYHYVIDSLKQFFTSKGIIITFSGVDGAGKSTVIENIKLEVEKKLRKQVVVIRHRPSLLPILSVWTKGKEKAKQDVINKLPRQGTNTSMLSSLLRFTYYYTDYLFGQFYIYFKYVLRGKVVLYDRYYFDFINDSRRSNIQLPKSISKLGYKFLLKPDINAFLYADAEVILSRKKELNKETIKSLTNDYLTLFKKFDSKSSKRYIAIENINLKNTVDIIMTEVTSKIA